MAESESRLVYKIWELEVEMKATGLWQVEVPDWVNYFEEKLLFTGKDFAQWLQYIFIPNQLQQTGQSATLNGRKITSPAAVNFFADDVHKGTLLQILIEIDSLL